MDTWEEPGTMKLDDNDLIDGQGAARLLHASIYTVRDYIRDLGL
jgi:hypothetical protein